MFAFLITLLLAIVLYSIVEHHTQAISDIYNSYLHILIYIHDCLIHSVLLVLLQLIILSAHIPSYVVNTVPM